LTTCATLINTNYTEVNLYSKQENVKVSFSDTSDYAFTPTKMKVERSREPLYIILP